MDIVFRPYQAYAVVYLDDVVIHFSTWLDDLYYRREVLAEL